MRWSRLGVFDMILVALSQDVSRPERCQSDHGSLSSGMRSNARRGRPTRDYRCSDTRLRLCDGHFRDAGHIGAGYRLGDAQTPHRRRQVQPRPSRFADRLCNLQRRSAASSSLRPISRTATAAHLRAWRDRQQPAQTGADRTRSSSDFKAIPAAKAAETSSGSLPCGRTQPGRAAVKVGAATGEATGKSMTGIVHQTCGLYHNLAH